MAMGTAEPVGVTTHGRRRRTVLDRVTDGTGYRVTYRNGATDITSAVNTGTYSTGTLAPGATSTITVWVKVQATARSGSTVKVDVAARNGTGPFVRDVVRAKVSAT